jgi:glycosyltransferase involved in cell wall biosynthesis
MKILYAVPFVPWEIKVRSFNLIPRLARRHEIHLVCLSGTQATVGQKEWLNTHCRTVTHVAHSKLKGAMQCALALPSKKPLRMAYVESPAARDAVRRLCEQIRPDVVYVERWRALEFIPTDLKVPMVCDPTDSMSLYNQRLMNAGAWWEKVLGWEEYGKFSRCEGALARRANIVVFCSRLDRDCVRRQAPEVRYELVPNGVDCSKYAFKLAFEEEDDLIVFTGSLQYRPNRSAVGYFLQQVFPRVREAVPGAKFLVVGNGASAALAGYRKIPGFQIVDFVPDLRPYLAKAAVAVAPLTVGAGVSNKLGEGFAIGTPVVSTPLACGDLPVVSGNELLIGRTAVEFAEHVILLLKSATLRSQIALRARRFIEAYDWEVVTRSMETLLEQAAVGVACESRKPLFSSAD